MHTKRNIPPKARAKRRNSRLEIANQMMLWMEFDFEAFHPTELKRNGRCANLMAIELQQLFRRGDALSLIVVGSSFNHSASRSRRAFVLSFFFPHPIHGKTMKNDYFTVAGVVVTSEWADRQTDNQSHRKCNTLDFNNAARLKCS